MNLYDITKKNYQNKGLVVSQAEEVELGGWAEERKKSPEDIPWVDQILSTCWSLISVTPQSTTTSELKF